jgi:hypothetical protein
MACVETRFSRIVNLNRERVGFAIRQTSPRSCVLVLLKRAILSMSYQEFLVLGYVFFFALRFQSREVVSRVRSGSFSHTLFLVLWPSFCFFYLLQYVF